MADYKAMYIKCISMLSQIDDDLILLREKIKQAQIAADNIYLNTTESNDQDTWRPTVVTLPDDSSGS